MAQVETALGSLVTNYCNAASPPNFVNARIITM